MFDVAVLPSDLEYCRTYIEHVCESKPSWFRIIGKVVAVVRKSVPKRALYPLLLWVYFLLVNIF